MAGIYLHIPFCKQACHYCDFHFTVLAPASARSQSAKKRFLDALKEEIGLRQDFLEGERIDTVYFGGGTPSLLSVEEISDILETLFHHYDIAPEAELTLEANPDDLSAEKIAALRQTPVNRLSIGVQSFLDEDLKLMNRAHTAEEAIMAIKTAQKHGFENISIDLIYGTQTLTNEGWAHNLDLAFSLGVPHLSAYCLTVEPKTAMSYFIRAGKMTDVNEKKAAGQFMLLMEKMKAMNFLHYEISNFCKEGHISSHNSSYWQGKSYLGLGPSAHSFNGKTRQWNIANNSRYIQALEQHQMNPETEQLTTCDRYNEYVMTSLRTMWGCDTDYIVRTFGNRFSEHCNQEAGTFIRTADIRKENDTLYLTAQGKLIADKIAAQLFLTEDINLPPN